MRAEVLHTGTVGGKPLRFFAPPVLKPDLPWHALEDLYRCLDLPRPVRREMMSKTVKRWAPDLRTVRVGREAVMIAPHFMAQGLIQSLEDVLWDIGRVPRNAYLDYARAGAVATAALLDQLKIPSNERTKWMLSASGGDPSVPIAEGYDEALGGRILDGRALQRAYGMSDAEFLSSIAFADDVTGRQR